MQARHDSFVSFSDGKTIFNELLYLAEGLQHVQLQRSDSTESSDSGGIESDSTESSDSGGIEAVYGAMRRALHSYTDLFGLPGTFADTVSGKPPKGVSDSVLSGKKNSNSMVCDLQSAEFVEIAGGHCTGFVRCGALLPDAVLSSLDRLREKAAAAGAV